MFLPCFWLDGPITQRAILLLPYSGMYMFHKDGLYILALPYGSSSRATVLIQNSVSSLRWKPSMRQALLRELTNSIAPTVLARSICTSVASFGHKSRTAHVVDISYRSLLPILSLSRAKIRIKQASSWESSYSAYLPQIGSMSKKDPGFRICSFWVFLFQSGIRQPGPSGCFDASPLQHIPRSSSTRAPIAPTAHHHQLHIISSIIQDHLTRDLLYELRYSCCSTKVFGVRSQKHQRDTRTPA
jgi:hypothetical protein